MSPACWVVMFVRWGINPTGAEKVLGRVQKKILSWPSGSFCKDMKRLAREVVDFFSNLKLIYVGSLLMISHSLNNWHFWKVSD